MGYPGNAYGRGDQAPDRGQMYDSEGNLFDLVDFLQAMRDGRFPVQGVGADKIIDLRPSVAAGAHAQHDVIVATEEIENAMRVNGGDARLQAVTLNDLDDEGLSLEIAFFDQDISIGAEGATADIGANGAAPIGRVLIYSSDYSDYTSAQTAMASFQPFYLRAAAGSRSIWYAVIAREAAASLTTTGLQIKLHLQRN